MNAFSGQLSNGSICPGNVPSLSASVMSNLLDRIADWASRTCRPTRLVLCSPPH